jgi:hypothetical protein
MVILSKRFEFVIPPSVRGDPEALGRFETVILWEIEIP